LVHVVLKPGVSTLTGVSAAPGSALLSCDRSWWVPALACQQQTRLVPAQKKLDSLIDRGQIRSSDLDNRTMDALEGAQGTPCSLRGAQCMRCIIVQHDTCSSLLNSFQSACT